MGLYMCLRLLENKGNLERKNPESYRARLPLDSGFRF